MSNLSTLLKELAVSIPTIRVDEIISTVGGDVELSGLDVDTIGASIKEAHREQLSGVMKNHTVALNKAKDDAYKAAERKVRTDTETAIATKFNYSDEFDNFDDLLNKVYSNNNSNNSSQSNNESKQNELKLKKQLQELQMESQKTIDDLKKGFEREKTITSISSKALNLLDSLNPNYTGNATVDGTIKNTFLNQLAKFDYKGNDNNYEIYNGEELVTDNIEEHIKSVASNFFTFKVASERKSPNGDGSNQRSSGSNGNGSQLKYQGKLPETKEELDQIKMDKNIPLDQRKELQDWGREKFSQA